MFTVSVLALMFAGTAAFVALFGWFEDFAGRRKPQLWPGALGPTRGRVTAGPASSSAAMAVSGAFGFFTVGATSVEALSTRGIGATTAVQTASAAGSANATGSTTASATHSLRTPSQAPAPPNVNAVITPVVVAASTGTGDAGDAADTDNASTDTPADPTAAKLLATAKSWLEQNGVEGVQFGISKAGVVYQVGAAGSLGADDTYDIWSVTKTLTTTLVLREVEAGNLDLDAPLKPLSALPSFDASQFTVRELLSHSTGLVNYRDTPTYGADPTSITSPEAALADAASQPLMFSPGTKSFYSSTNYLVLGFLLEDLTGKPFGQLMSESLLQPLGLDSAQVTPPMPGEPNFSTGGLLMDTSDLLAWTSYYFRDHADLSPDIWSMMTKIDPASSLGTGLIGYCPCTDSPSGDYQWKGLGYAGSTTLIQYSPSDDVAIVVNLSEPLWKPDFFGSVLGLFEAFRAVADAAS